MRYAVARREGVRVGEGKYTRLSAAYVREKSKQTTTPFTHDGSAGVCYNV